MTIFGSYARYYDVFYKDKDYAGETRFVVQLLRRHAPDARRLLELGCGTGHHGALLAEAGYEVHGVDTSGEMLERARTRKAELAPAIASRLELSPGDARSVRIAKTFDAIVSLFHVMSYQQTNADLDAALATATAHLPVGGVLLFDCWYGPAVLAERPSVRVRRLEDDELRVVRVAEPVLRANDNCVDVNYHVMAIDKRTAQVEELRETHTMRYLFHPEVERMLADAGFELVEAAEWMTGRPCSLETWNAYFIARKRG